MRIHFQCSPRGVRFPVRNAGRQNLTAAVILAVILAAGVLCAAPYGSSQPTLNAEVTGRVQVGSRVPDLGLPMLDFESGALGKIVWLSDFVGDPRGGNLPQAKQAEVPHGQAEQSSARMPATKLLLLHFFASWCVPCRNEVAFLGELQERYGAQGLGLLSINYRRPFESVEAATAEARSFWHPPPKHPVLFERYTRRVESVFLGDKVVLPTQLLLTPEGVIVARYQGGGSKQYRELEAEIRKRLRPAADARDASR